jgi:SH3-like domain-containing protein
MADPAQAPFRTTVNANLRQEASLKAPVVTVLKAGSVVTLDVHRTQDGDWLPVVYVRGWLHKSVVEALE